MEEHADLGLNGNVVEPLSWVHNGPSVADQCNNLRLSRSKPNTPPPPPADSVHVIPLSSIEHCMPRAYIRVCLAYRLPEPSVLPLALDKLRNFVRKLVDAKPYLSGYLVPAPDRSRRPGRVEVRFTDEEFLSFPCLQERRYSHDEMPFTYDQLDQAALPPSLIRPDLVSALPEGADENRAPVLRVQANIVRGGLIVSFYLHHCISDGTGLGLLISGSVLNDEFTFIRHINSDGHPIPSLTVRLDTFAKYKTIIREALAWSDPNQISTRHIAHKFYTRVSGVSSPTQAPGRGVIFTLPCPTLQSLKESLQPRCPSEQLTTHDTVQALLWHSMTRARIPSLQPIYGIRHSTLLIPINIRSRLKESGLPPNYFGSAVDFASVKLDLSHLSRHDEDALAVTATQIRKSIAAVDDVYVRASIALANSKDPTIDVRDLLASNMNRITGADMYITSWWKQPLYTSDLEMGLGRPDWVRKPWSKDPGSCIILPCDDRKDVMEILVQMTEADMARLLGDEEFCRNVTRIIE